MTVLLFFSSFLYYLAGLNGTIPSYRDSGDLIASIHTLGIAHPPGYALYVLLGKLFVTLLPFGNVAYRVNVLSALCAAFAVVLLFHFLLQESGPGRLGAFVIAALFALSPAVVALSRVAEMYTLSACLASAIILCLRLDHPRGTSYAALLLGLGLSVHPTLIFLAPLFLISPARTFTRSSVLYLLLGLSVFLYLPIRAAQHPVVNWGDPSHWRNFWRVVTRADYGGLKLHPEQSVFSWSLESIGNQLRYFLVLIKGEWGWAALLLGSAGFVRSLREPKSRRWSLLLLVSWILSGPGFFLLSNLPLQEPTTPAILQPYLVLISLLWAPFLLFGFQWVASRRPSSLLVPALAAAILMSARPWGWTSQRNDFYTYDYARNLLRSLPREAVLYDPDDPTCFSIQVLQTVEKRRSDIALISFFRTRWGYEQMKQRWPDLLPPVSIDSGQELQRILWTYSAQKRHFYAELPQKLGSIPYRAEGLVYAAEVGPFVNSETASLQRAETLLALYPQRGDFVTLHHPDFFTRHLIGYYAAAHCNLGLAYANTKNWTKAVDHYRSALEIDPELSAAFNNWGIVAFSHQDYAQAYALFQKGQAVDPNNEMLRKNAQLALQKMPKLL